MKSGVTIWEGKKKRPNRKYTWKEWCKIWINEGEIYIKIWEQSRV